MSDGASRLAWLAAALLAVGLAAAVAWPGQDAGPVRPAPLPQPAPDAVASEPVASYAAAMLARPLFTPGRRPPAAEAGAAPATPDRPQPPRLAGILVTSAGRSAIFAAPPGDGHATVVQEGGSVGPWRVEAIRAAEVQLAGPGGRRTVRPAYSEGPAAAGQLPLSAQADTRPLSLPPPPGPATFPNAPVLPAARTPQ